MILIIHAKVRILTEESEMDTIFDRPRGLRLIGITQMTFGVLAAAGAVGIFFAWQLGVPEIAELGLIYVLLIIFGAAIPSLVIGNYVDDLRRNAVFAQIFYSTFAVIAAGSFIVVRGIGYFWTIPLFETEIVLAIGNVALLIVVVEAIFALYLVVRWNHVVPPPGAVIERDRRKARMIEERLLPTPLSPSLLGPDGQSILTPEETQRVMEIRKMETDEGMAILCSNCGGATPLTKMDNNNTVPCSYCGVTLAVSSVFVPCENHPEFLAATTCAVCGDRFCRRCLTAQEPPVDERWQGSTVYLCRNCFEGRFRPAVTTSSLVIPIDKLFSQSGKRFSRVGRIYKRFLGKYLSIMRYVLEFSIRLAGTVAKASRKGKGGDDAAAIIIIIIVAIVAIPVAIGILLLVGSIIIIPLIFYIGLIGITIEAVKIIRRTDFLSIDKARKKGIEMGRPVKKEESKLREDPLTWEHEDRKQMTEGFFRR